MFPNDTTATLTALQDDQAEAIRRVSSLLPEELRDMPPAQLYQLALKRRKVGSILQSALSQAGYPELSRMMRFRKLSEEEGAYQ